LRKQKRHKVRNNSELNPIFPEVIKSLWNDIKNYLCQESWVNNKENVEELGKIFSKNK
jgi:hypothetical protein